MEAAAAVLLLCDFRGSILGSLCLARLHGAGSSIPVTGAGVGAGAAANSGASMQKLVKSVLMIEGAC